MIYVFPHCMKHEDEIERIGGISRLYAYPAKPRFENHGHITILDSGAYGLSQCGRRITLNYMKKLSEHYKTFATKNTFCVAPDEFLNPVQSMMNMRSWFKNGFYKNVAAVIQAEQKNKINLNSLKSQADFYRKYTDVAFFSNNNLYAEDAKLLHLEELFKYMKSIGFKWIHVLGAGWSIRDILEWQEIKYFDSCDSVAYYTAKDVTAFGSLNPVENVRRITACLKI